MSDRSQTASQAATGTRSTTGASSATSARATASCTRASAGFCFVRARAGDEIVLTTYGRSSGFCVDPIEKKPLNHFLPGTPVLSFGTAGCNLACKFCQNWDISKARESTACRTRPRRRRSPQAAAQSGCRSVAFTYNDPVIFLEYAIDVAQACRERGHQDRRGHRRLHLRGAARRVLPAHGRRQRRPEGFTERFYKKPVLGPARARCSRRSPISSTRPTVWFEITTLLIPGENDSRRRDRGAQPLGDGAARARRAAPFHRLPPRLQDAATCRRRRRPRCAWHGVSLGMRACATSTPATCTTKRARAPTVIACERTADRP